MKCIKEAEKLWDSLGAASKNGKETISRRKEPMVSYATERPSCMKTERVAGEKSPEMQPLDLTVENLLAILTYEVSIK